jgi:glycosyltransferase involved in cell wall biosynthesis
VLSVGFDGRALVSPAAGVRRYTRELFGALASLGSCTVVAVGAPSGVDLPPGVVRGPDAAALPSNVGWMVTGLPRAARRAGIDLFHAPSYTAPVGGPRPLVLTIHDVSYERHPEWYPYRRDVLRRAFYRWSARTADVVITDSEFSKSEIVAAFSLDRQRIAVVPLAAAPIFTPGDGSLPDLPPRFLLHVGDLHARRNVEMVMHGLIALGERRPDLADVALVLVGPDRGTGRRLREVAGRVPRRLAIFTERLDDPALRACYRSAAALVYPSRYEGFGLPLLEAMACGCPVVAARTSSIPEVAGDAAILLDPDDAPAWTSAVERVLDSPDARARMRQASLDRAARFSWRRTAEETARIYAGVCAGRRR